MQTAEEQGTINNESIESQNLEQATGTQDDDFQQARKEMLENNSFLKEVQTTTDSDNKEGNTKNTLTEPPEGTGAEPQKENQLAQEGAEPKITLPDGRELTVAEILEWEQGNLRQADYSRKTQELANRRREFDEMVNSLGGQEEAQKAVNLYQALLIDPVGTLNYLFEQAEQAGFTEPLSAEEIQRSVELESLRREKAEREQQDAIDFESRAFAQLEQYMRALDEQYKEYGFNQQDVLAFCKANNLTDPALAYKAMAADVLQQRLLEHQNQIETAKNQAVQEYINKRVTKTQSYTPPLGTTNTGATGLEENKITTFEEARKAAMEYLNAN